MREQQKSSPDHPHTSAIDRIKKALHHEKRNVIHTPLPKELAIQKKTSPPSKVINNRPIKQVFVGAWNAVKPESQGKIMLQWYDALRFPKLTPEEKKLHDKVHTLLKHNPIPVGWAAISVEAAVVASVVTLGYRALRRELWRRRMSRFVPMPSEPPQNIPRVPVDALTVRLRSQGKLSVHHLRHVQGVKLQGGAGDASDVNAAVQIFRKRKQRKHDVTGQIGRRHKERHVLRKRTRVHNHIDVVPTARAVQESATISSTVVSGDSIQRGAARAVEVLVSARPDLTKVPLDALMRIDHAIQAMPDDKARAFVDDVLAGGGQLWDEFIASGGRVPADNRQISGGKDVNFSFAFRIWEQHRIAEPLNSELPKMLMDKAYELAPLTQPGHMEQFMDFVEAQSGLKVRTLSKALGNPGGDYLDFLHIFQSGFSGEPRLPYGKRVLNEFGISILEKLGSVIPDVIALPHMQPHALAAMIADFVDQKGLGSEVTGYIDKAKAATTVLEQQQLVNEAFGRHIVASLGEATMGMDVDTRTRALIDILTSDIVEKLNIPNLFERLGIGTIAS